MRQPPIEAVEIAAELLLERKLGDWNPEVLLRHLATHPLLTEAIGGVSDGEYPYRVADLALQAAATRDKRLSRFVMKQRGDADAKGRT